MNLKFTFGCFLFSLCAFILVHNISAQTVLQLNQTQIQGYGPSYEAFWSVSTTPPPACGVVQSSGAQGPPLYSYALLQGTAGTPDQKLFCMDNGTGPAWYVEPLTPFILAN